jgi:hypothetical protein
MHRFPAPSVLRELAGERSASHHDHGDLLAVELESARQVNQAKRVSFALPASVGQALVTFVQPATRFVQPGASASFAVLDAARPEPAPSSSPSFRLSALSPWLSAGAVVLALAALASSLWLRRRRESSSPPSVEASPS